MAKLRKQFFDTNIFVIQPEKASSNKKNYWNVLNPGGVRLAIMHHTPDSLLVRFLRSIGFSAQYGTRILVEDPDGGPLMAFRKSFSLGLFSAAWQSIEGAKGVVKERKSQLSHHRYELCDASGKLLFILEGDWGSYSLQMKDASNNAIGKISRRSDEVTNRVVFPDQADYYVVHLYIDQPDRQKRGFLLGTAAAAALLLR